MDKDSTIKSLVAAGFYLGGSRHMAEKYPDKIKVTEKTDWDFSCIDSPKNMRLLNLWGFRKACEENSYLDNTAKSIWKHHNHNIDVVARVKMDIYKAAFESIPADIYIKHLWKSAPGREKRRSGPDFKNHVRDYFNSLFKMHEATSKFNF